MADIFRGPLLVKTWHPDANAWWRTWTASYNLNLIGKDRFPPGTQRYELAPFWSGYPRQPDLRTWTLNLNTSTLAPVTAPVGVQESELPPAQLVRQPRGRGYWTWTQSFPLTLIGQDQLPVGDRQFQLPPLGAAPAFPVSLRNFLEWYFIGLIGKDALPVGDRHHALPPRPHYEPATRTWTWSYNLSLVGQD